MLFDWRFGWRLGSFHRGMTLHSFMPLSEVHVIACHLRAHLRILIEKRSQVLVMVEVLIVLTQRGVLGEVSIDILMFIQELIHLCRLPVRHIRRIGI